MKKVWLIFLLSVIFSELKGQINEPIVTGMTPPMGWIVKIDSTNEKTIREMADALVSSGLSHLGYKYLFIDDGWQGGRDKRNYLIADPEKFPSGMKALSDYVHQKGLKLGINSAASQKSCKGYAGSLNFEDQDAATLTLWGIDYLRYSYCGDVIDSAKILTHYETMAEAIAKAGNKIGVGYTQPWQKKGESELLAPAAIKRSGSWKKLISLYKPGESYPVDSAFSDLIHVKHGRFSAKGQIMWNDPAVLAVGLKVPGNRDFTDTEYQSQISLYSFLGYPLIVGTDILNLMPETKRVLMNEELIAINQDSALREAELKVNQDDWQVYIKQLSDGDYTVAVINRSAKMRNYSLSWSTLGLADQFVIRDIWQHQFIGKGRRWRGSVLGHEIRVFRLKKV